jgi:Mg-chelatase subunit ChlD
VLSLTSPDLIEKESNVDLICIIDVSGSMKNQKLNQIKLSLKYLISFMTPQDRLAVILFNDDAKIYLNLSFMTNETKKIFMEKIEKIMAKGGTNILSGLEKAVEILKEEKSKENNNEPMNQMRVKTIMLLSDGYDNDYEGDEIAEEMKKMTKGFNLSFTMHTFGYGEDYDPKLMSKLANLRDGSFFAVENINKVQNYFVNALGGCMSTIYNEVKINIKMLKDTYKFIKIYGQDKLYNFESKNNELSFGIIQVISGKEYTYTFEVELPEIIQINENIFEVEMTGDNDEKIIEMGKYKIVGGSFSIADEEYLKNKLYETLDEAMKLKEEKKTEQMNLKLNEMKSWIEKNYEGENKSQYLKKLNEALGYMKDEYTFQRVGRTRITADIYENQLRRGGIYSNNYQAHMLNSMPKK